MTIVEYLLITKDYSVYQYPPLCILATSQKTPFFIDSLMITYPLYKNGKNGLMNILLKFRKIA